MSEPYVGEVRLFANTYVPEGWVLCNGNALSTQVYPQLYAVIGNLYGGNQTSFNVPNLNGRVAIGTGALGTKNYQCGNTDGVDSVALTMTTMPAHTHQLQKKNTTATGPDGKTAVPDAKSDLGGLSSTAGTSYSAVLPTGPANTALHASTLGLAGAATVTPHENRQPFLGLYFAIATTGMFPIHS